MKGMKSDRTARHRLIPRLEAAEIVLHGVLKLRWNDGLEGLVDLRPVIARGNIFVWLQEPAHFAAFSMSAHGHSLLWKDAAQREIEFGADMLHSLCIRQRELLRLAG